VQARVWRMGCCCGCARARRGAVSSFARGRARRGNKGGKRRNAVECCSFAREDDENVWRNKVRKEGRVDYND